MAIGLLFGAVMLLGNIAGVRSLVAEPVDAFIILAGAVTTLSPFVIATAIGLLAQE